jgi:type II secretory pathway pseudopilin PulG
MKSNTGGWCGIACVLAWMCCSWTAAWAAPKPEAPAGSRAGAAAAVEPAGSLLFHQVRYEARVSDEEARFTAEFEAEALGRRELNQPLFEGELALLPPQLPAGLRVRREGNQYRLLVARPGRYRFRLELVARVKRAEPWNQVSFRGPAAAIASLTAEAAGANVDLQLLGGTTVATTQTNGAVRVQGFLGAEQTVGLRWSRSGGGSDAARKAVMTVETTASIQLTPTVIKHVTQLQYDLLQGKTSRLSIALPASQALTRLAGEQIRDWEIKRTGTNAGGQPQPGQLLEVQFIKPIEKACALTLYSEQPVDGGGLAQVECPQPLAVERESGAITLTTEDTLAEVASATGLRQVNAPGGALAAYRFHGRPFALALRLHRIEPVVSVVERVSARLEETRLVSAHSLSLNVEKAGVYAVDLLPAPGFLVADVRGDGVEDWKWSATGTGSTRVLRVNFATRVLGPRRLEVQLEQPLPAFPEQVSLGPIRVAGASRESSEIGAGAAAGLHLKTAELTGLREVAVRALQPRGAQPAAAPGEELLAYQSQQPDWRLTLATERVAARVVAEVFNLVTIGDGIVGGSATIRYGLLNQGVQEFQVAVPPGWKNVEFTGPNIRRKEQTGEGRWTIGLQDKAWGGYTLVITYDYQFDPRGALLPLGGLQLLGVERETGSVAITTAASLKLTPQEASDFLRRVDELELSAADRGLITRSVLLAYQYGEPGYRLDLHVQRFSEAGVLSAIADRTQLTTVLTEAGELLTQASFMVKNNDRQFQRFKLPAGARFWSCHVNGAPVKAEQDSEWLMAPLPRGANRDQAFAVDIVYAEKKGVKLAWTPQPLVLQAPQTDVPNTYAEWQLFAPTAFRLSGFAGNMTPVLGTTYDLSDAWRKFTRFYWDFLREAGPGLFLFGTLAVLVLGSIGSAIRRGWNGLLNVLVVVAIIAILSAMLLPALSRSKARAQRINAMNSLKQIGLAAKTFAIDNNDRLPNSYEEMMNELSTDKITYDPETGQRFIYLGAGYESEKITPDSVLAYSPPGPSHYRCVLFANGSVQQLNETRFSELTQRGFILLATPQQASQNQQANAVRQAQLPAANAPVAAPAEAAATDEANAAMALVPRGRSIRIDIPHEGQAFSFTKVLNLEKRPLAVELSVMKLQTYQSLLMLLQLTLFVFGLGVVGWQWRGRRRSLIVTLGLALALSAVISLLLAWRLLHLALIWTAPVLLLAGVGWLAWRFWPRPAPKTAEETGGLEPGAPPVIAALVLLIFSACGARATEISVLSASYSGAVDERVGQIEATLQLSASGAGQRLKLFGPEVAVQQFSAKPSGARLEREGNTVAVVLPRGGEVALQLKLLVKLGGEVTRRELSFGVPPALTSRFAFTLDQPEADVEFPSAISVQRTASGQQTRVEGRLGAGDKVELFWTPRVKRAADIAANVICQNAALVTFSGGAVNARATLDYQVTQGELRQARVRVPEGQRLLRVEGEGIRNWEVKSDAGSQVVCVELLKGVAPAYRLVVETEKPLESLPASVRVEVPHAVDVKRETGLLAVRADEDLELAMERTGELYRIDVEEFTRTSGQKASGAINAFRFLKPELDLQVRAAAMQPQIEAVARHSFRLGQEQLNLTTTLDYTIKRAGVFSLKVAIPADYHLDAVAGARMLQWIERAEAGQRVVEVTLSERTSGAYSLKLELSRPLKDSAGTLALTGVQPLGTEKLSGFVSVAVEPGIAVKPAGFDGLTEVPAASLGQDSASGTGVLAYKFIAGAPDRESGWRLAVASEKVESWVRAEFVNTLTLSDTLISGRAEARFDIQNAPVKELVLRIPAGFRNVEISGANIRRRDHTGELWKIEFQSRIRGVHRLAVSWEEPRKGKTNELELRGVGAEQVERETGILAIVARPPLQVNELGAAELKPIDLRDLPDWAGRANDATVLAYRYLRPDYRLRLEARRFAEAEVLQALVENLNLSTVVADDGQMMTQMSMTVRNQARQHLEIGLPTNATVWSAFVAGQAVRPSVKDGRLLLPLEHSVGDDAPIAIELIYVGGGQFPEQRGQLRLMSPQLDAPLKSARWELFLPMDYRYSDFAGTMAHEVETALIEPSSFSFLDYSSRESKNKAELAKEVKSQLSSAQKKLSTGNVKEALADYNRARANGGAVRASAGEARKVEADLRRAQGNNLIQAQAFFNVMNSSQVQEPQQAAVAANSFNYDNATAEAQWTKLQQAQDLAGDVVQPIRVNLPTRGLRHGFTQILQTEPGKPLTIELLATSARTVSWPGRLGAAALAFLALWSAVALALRRSTGGGLCEAQKT